MQRHRFYAAQGAGDDGLIHLDEEESHHLVRVLRLREGDEVFAFDGEGGEWTCEVEEAGRSGVRLGVRSRLVNEVESQVELTLGQALLKGEKFDWVVQKATELGVRRIVPLLTEHCEVRRGEERSEQRLGRWRRISMEAVKQSGRRVLVAIDQPQRFADFCASAQNGPVIIFSERGGSRLRELPEALGGARHVKLLIGPEGGWSDAEIAEATAAGAHFAGLGPRILRAETAAVAALALCQHLLGDIE